EYSGDIVDRISTCSMNLRDAAETVRILDVFLFLGENLAFIEQRQDLTGNSNLTRLWTYSVYVRKERFTPSVKRVERQCSDDVREAEESVCMKTTPDSVRAHELRSVEKGKSFLRAKVHGCPSNYSVDFVGRVNCSVE